MPCGSLPHNPYHLLPPPSPAIPVHYLRCTVLGRPLTACPAGALLRPSYLPCDYIFVGALKSSVGYLSYYVVHNRVVWGSVALIRF